MHTEPPPDPEPDVAAQVVAALHARDLSMATAESLTGGGLGARVTTVSGASAVYAGGVVSYATRVKREVLGVPADVLDRQGAVSAACAEAMADGARKLMGADVGVSTTGVAGPEPQEGKPVGLVYVAVADATGAVSRELRLSGDRAAIQATTLEEALNLVLHHVAA